MGDHKITKEEKFNTDTSWMGVIQWGGLFLFVSGAIALIFFILVIATQQTLPVPAKEVFGKMIGYAVISAGAFTLPGAISVIVEEVPIIFPVIGVIMTAIWQSGKEKHKLYLPDGEEWLDAWGYRQNSSRWAVYRS